MKVEVQEISTSASLYEIHLSIEANDLEGASVLSTEAPNLSNRILLYGAC